MLPRDWYLFWRKSSKFTITKPSPHGVKIWQETILTPFLLQILVVRSNEGVSIISHISLVHPSVPGIRLPQTDPYMLTERFVRIHSIQVTAAKSFPPLQNTVTVYGSFSLSYGEARQGGQWLFSSETGFPIPQLSSVLCKCNRRSWWTQSTRQIVVEMEATWSPPVLTSKSSLNCKSLPLSPLSMWQ